MNSLIFLLYALAHAALFAWAMWLLLRYRQPATVPLLIVAFGLVYDNLLLAGGGALGHGPLLEQLSVPRFFMHAFGTPLLMLSALGLARRAGANWTRASWVALLVGALTLAMIALGVQAELLDLQLEPKREGDLLSYGNASTDGPPIPALVTAGVLLVAGWLTWRGGAGPWLLIGTIAQFIAGALGNAIAVAGNLGELALLASLVATDHLLSRRPASDPTAAGVASPGS